MSGFGLLVNNCDICGKTSWDLIRCVACHNQKEQQIQEEINNIRASNQCYYCKIPLAGDNWVIAKTSNSVPICVTCSSK